MILPIYVYGQPVLRKVAEDIPTDMPDLKQFIADMWETLAASEGIGLAAPQVGKAIRVVVIDLDPLAEDFPEYKDFKRVYINPHIVEYDDTNTDSSEEGCLSLPAIHEKVELIVIGEPRQPNGQPSENLERVRQFVNRWRKAMPQIPIEYYDERFTSVLAHQAMLDGGLRKKARQDKALVDEISATIILQDYMQSRRFKGGQ